MATIVIGGHARNVGKTSVVSAILSAWPERSWSAIKISSHWHDAPPQSDEEEICRIDEEFDGGSGTDTGRYLAAGASRSFWVRVRAGRLEDAVSRLVPLLHSSPDVIIESNGIVQFVEPDLFLMVLRCGVDDFKKSARNTLIRAHAIVAVNCDNRAAALQNLPGGAELDIPVFPVPDPQELPSGLTTFIDFHLK